MSKVRKCIRGMLSTDVATSGVRELLALQHGLCANKMARITSDCGKLRPLSSFLHCITMSWGKRGQNKQATAGCLQWDRSLAHHTLPGSLASMRMFSPPSLPLPLPYPHHHFHAVPALMGWMDSGLLGWGMLHVGVNQIMRTGFANFHKLPRGPWLLPRLEASCVSLSAAR